MAHDRETCVDEEQWLTTDKTKTAVNTHAMYVYYECPECGREYSYVYSLTGLYSEDDEEYVWRD